MKTTEEIYQQMAAAFARETGAEVGANGELAVRLYAVAAEIYALYVQSEWVARQCFPQTAEGEYLDRHAQLRGLERKEASRAEGLARFSVDEAAGTDIAIEAGTVCMTAGQVRFETVEYGVIPAGQLWADIPARAVEPGVSGNIGAGSLLTMAVPPVGVSRCGNLFPFSGGSNEETDESLRARVLDSFRRLPNGANSAYYEQEAMSFEEVAAVEVLPRARGIGTVDVVVATLAGVPEAELLALLQDHFEQRREIAVDVRVRAPETVAVDVTVQVACEDSQDQETVLGRVRDAVSAWFDGRRLGRDVLLAQLSSMVFGTEGVSNCVLTAPAADIPAACDQLPVLGKLTVEAMA